MATNFEICAPKKKRPRLGTRYQMELAFSNEYSKKEFLLRLDRVKRAFVAKQQRSIDNVELMNSLLDLVESGSGSSQEHLSNKNVSKSAKSMLKSSGIFTGHDETNKQSMFVCERSTFDDLIEGLMKKCQCGSVEWSMSRLDQKGHVVRTEFLCRVCKHKQWWASSRVFGGRYLINQKLIHAFTCAGILPSQYIHFCDFADIGGVGKRYIKSVYKSKGYIDVVSSCTYLSMKKAIDDVKSIPDYEEYGEWVITDARHDSTSNAYHTTVPCISGSIHKILGCVTLSKKEHTCAQTRELACTKLVLPQVISKGLNVVEVAHDNSPCVKMYITQDLNLVNSYDTWHGTKNVAKAMKSIAIGALKRSGKTWFPELSDKRKSTKTHLYYCMKNCENSPTKLRSSITTIVQHYQGQHSQCNTDSFCKRPGYSPSKVQLTDPIGIATYEKKLRETLIYVNADSYCRCRDTFWVESFNHHLLTYIPKRIHFGTETFIMRMNLACMDWNENVERSFTSECFIPDARRPDRRTAFKVLVKKTFSFVDGIWSSYTQKNTVAISPVESEPMETDQEVEEDALEEDDILNDGFDVDDDTVYDDQEIDD